MFYVVHTTPMFPDCYQVRDAPPATPPRRWR